MSEGREGRWTVPLSSATRTVFLVALSVRLAVVAWAAGRVPPTADGKFYHVVAGRIAQGEGYTWLWPDGVVTYAAHYPVGYPALLGATYFLFGTDPLWAMLQNALLGAVGCAAMCGVAREALRRGPFHEGGEGAVLAAGLSVALLPTLVLYVPGLMTEGAVAAVVALSARVAVALRGMGRQARLRRWGMWLLLGLLAGGSALLRPQSVLLSPVLGWLATGGEGTRWSLRLRSAALVTALALAVCAPWTLRNCAKMERCLFVSANGGWNLLIGTYSEGQGAWVPIDGDRVPERCRSVFQEAAKDRCFGEAAISRVTQAPLPWLALTPAKWRQTFDFTAAAADHLREAGVISAASYRATAAVELVSQRLLLALGALGLAAWADRRRRSRLVVGGLLALSLLGFGGISAVLGWVGLLGLALVSGAWAKSAGVAVVCSASLLTFAVHGVFFGAGRYALPLNLWAAPLTALGALSVKVLTARGGTGDTPDHGPH